MFVLSTQKWSLFRFALTYLSCPLVLIAHFSLLDDSTSESRRCRAEMETCEDALDETMEDLSDYHFDGLPRKISVSDKRTFINVFFLK